MLQPLACPMAHPVRRPAQPVAPRHTGRLGLALLSAVALLSACGGGGGGSAADTVVLAAGDAFTYSTVTTPSGGEASTSYSTQTLVSLNTSSGKATRTDTFGNGAAAQTLSFSAQDVLTGRTFSSTACPRVAVAGNNTRTFATSPLTVGQTWTYQYTDTCTSGANVSISTVLGSGTVLAFETLTGATGSFNAVKYSYSESETESASGSLKFTDRSATCWRDMEMGVLLGCDTTVSSRATVGATPVLSSVVTSLVGFRVADHPSPVLTTARFAGQWNLSYTGSDTGSCSSLSVSATGVVSANCSSDLSGAYTLSGTVNANGVLTADASTGARFTGTLSTPLLGAGNWLGNGGAVGAWTATHR